MAVVRKGYTEINFLLPMSKKWRKSLKEGFGALLTDLSKVFDCLHQEFLIAKHYAYRVKAALLTLKQRAKLDKTYSWWSKIIFRVSYCCILGPLLFNIFLSNIF